MISLNFDWEYVDRWTDAFLSGGSFDEVVQIPHSVGVFPLHQTDPKDYEKICGYRKKVFFTQEESNKRTFLQLDGAAHSITVYLNGKEIGSHHCGYTAYRVELTDQIRFGQENEIVIKLDSTENPAIPPFGFVVDYLTYGGIYRSIWLDQRPQEMIEDIFVTTPDLSTLELAVSYSGEKVGGKMQIEVFDAESTLLDETLSVQEHYRFEGLNVQSWSLEEPHLYTCRLTMNGEDVKEVRFGFRTIRLDADHFYLNDKAIFLRGLNRHQSYPYIGYAATDSLQREDARILKEELYVNMVRTSHYPQAQSFIDACDEYGLLVFTEIPGWQHIGDEAWKDLAVQNTREMVLQYRNHPSIVVWGVRINESLDDDVLYTKTNEVAHLLDPTRPTTGVRYLEKSHLLEDIYGYNDFSHMGSNAGTKARKDVTSDLDKPLLITEANGHMFPTKQFDRFERRQEHALRHARVMNDAMDGQHIGVLQWCMFDYQTHRDFGSGDRICYHGIMDHFRNPKLAASVYASQQDDDPVLEIGSSMEIGDYDGGCFGAFYVFTNADEIRLYKNGDFVKSFTPDPNYSALAHGPVKIDDTLGEMLHDQEGYEGTKERLTHKVLLSVQQNGMTKMPKSDMLRALWLMLRYGMKYEDGVRLFSKYFGGWGGDAVEWRFDAIKDGRVVKSAIRKPSADLHLEVIPSATQLCETSSYDMTAIRIRLLDAYNNPVNYMQHPVKVTVEGPFALIGPDVIVLEGGTGGIYLKTCGKSGSGKVTLEAEQCDPVQIDFTVTGRDEKELHCSM